MGEESRAELTSVGSGDGDPLFSVNTVSWDQVLGDQKVFLPDPRKVHISIPPSGSRYSICH